MSRSFIDTSGWIALLSQDDRLHARAVARCDELVSDGIGLITNNYVVDETATHLRHGLGVLAALDFRRMLLDAVAARRLRIAWIDETAESEAWRILEQYSDVKLSLTDATRVADVFGCDSDFEALGFVVLPGPL